MNSGVPPTNGSNLQMTLDVYAAIGQQMRYIMKIGKREECNRTIDDESFTRLGVKQPKVSNALIGEV